ncbi:hypothetical protein LF41_777 [Lysobacter dokdonensis DS-58]|uniref:Uncharacterized protein n=1 Tax=Lysobacter dokdonensis DS-58 TaxID=1300345 RepID=A0A0A2WJ96_9GAMM|nr:hypothetical protein LF41_777 [Lysobacter dokdonensis DS-58]
MGFQVVRYKGLFGAEAYYRRIPFGSAVSKLFRALMLRFPVPQLTAFSQVLLQKPVVQGAA